MGSWTWSRKPGFDLNLYCDGSLILGRLWICFADNGVRCESLNVWNVEIAMTRMTLGCLAVCLLAGPAFAADAKIDAAVKTRLIHGLDDIGITLKQEEAIRAFEGRHSPQLYPQK